MKMSNVRSVLRRRSNSSIRSGFSAVFSGGTGESDMMVDVLAVDTPVAPEDRRLSLRLAEEGLAHILEGRVDSLSDSPGQGAVECCAVVARPLRSGRALSRPSETRIRIACRVPTQRLLPRHIDVQARR